MTQPAPPASAARRAATALAAATAVDALRASGPLRPALVGFDGFIDAIIHIVDQRQGMAEDAYTRLRTIEQFALRISLASGKSTNLELVVREERFGGNGPLMAGSLGRLGVPTTYIGAVGSETDARALHPLYRELDARCERVIPIAKPARTDALEFDDGKVMLGKPANIQSVTWPSLVNAVGLDALLRIIDGAALLGVVNWVMMGGVESIWQGLIDDVFPRLSPMPAGTPPRRVFIDLCDPAKRTDADIARALATLARMNALIPVTLGLNLAEAERIAHVAAVPAFQSRGMSTLGRVVQDAASILRAALHLDCVVIHPREGAGAATASASAWFEGPFTSTPRLSTGAGDHFNGGFAFAQTHGRPLDACLAVGCAVSGAYVRDAESPTLDRLIAFLRELPLPEGT